MKYVQKQSGYSMDEPRTSQDRLIFAWCWFWGRIFRKSLEQKKILNFMSLFLKCTWCVMACRCGIQDDGVLRGSFPDCENYPFKRHRHKSTGSTEMRQSALQSSVVNKHLHCIANFPRKTSIKEPKHETVMGVTSIREWTDTANIMHKVSHKALECTTCHCIGAGTMNNLYNIINIYPS